VSGHLMARFDSRRTRVRLCTELPPSPTPSTSWSTPLPPTRLPFVPSLPTPRLPCPSLHPWLPLPLHPRFYTPGPLLSTSSHLRLWSPLQQMLLILFSDLTRVRYPPGSTIYSTTSLVYPPPPASDYVTSVFASISRLQDSCLLNLPADEAVCFTSQ